METIDKINGESLPALADDSLVRIAEQAEKRIDAIKKIKALALRVTNPRDWIDEQGKPYLAVSGAEKVARLFGVSWRIDEPDKETLEDGHYQYTYKGLFTLGGQSIESIGTRSSKSPFFSRAHGKDIPANEIDSANVKKAALTNCIGNGITRVLGIRNLQWEEIEEIANINKKNVQSVQYKKGQKPSNGQQSQGAKKPMSEPQNKKFFAMAKGKDLSDAEVSEFRDWLKVHEKIETVKDGKGKITFSSKGASHIFDNFDDLIGAWINKKLETPDQEQSSIV